MTDGSRLDKSGLAGDRLLLPAGNYALMHDLSLSG